MINRFNALKSIAFTSIKAPDLLESFDQLSPGFERTRPDSKSVEVFNKQVRINNAWACKGFKASGKGAGLEEMEKLHAELSKREIWKIKWTWVEGEREGVGEDISEDRKDWQEFGSSRRR